MTITAYGAQAARRVQPEAAEFGNVRAKIGTIELAALAQNTTAAVLKLPADVQLFAVDFAIDALGSNTSIAIGTEKISDGTAVTDAVKATAATTSASSGRAVPQPISTGANEYYLTVTNTGSGAATGTVTLIAHYINRKG